MKKSEDFTDAIEAIETVFGRGEIDKDISKSGYWRTCKDCGDGFSQTIVDANKIRCDACQEEYNYEQEMRGRNPDLLEGKE